MRASTVRAFKATGGARDQPRAGERALARKAHDLEVGCVRAWAAKSRRGGNPVHESLMEQQNERCAGARHSAGAPRRAACAACRSAPIPSSAAREVGDGTWVGPHVVIEGHTRSGARTGSSSSPPSARRRRQEVCGPIPRAGGGDRNTLARGVTVNRARRGVGVTRIAMTMADGQRATSPTLPGRSMSSWRQPGLAGTSKGRLVILGRRHHARTIRAHRRAQLYLDGRLFGPRTCALGDGRGATMAKPSASIAKAAPGGFSGRRDRTHQRAYARCTARD